jgi:Ni/Fe-hydrogenase subunit HybB-like protein
VAVDVASGVALAAGGFAAAVLATVFHIERFRPLVRPALLTAMLGYTAVVVGLQADLGRYYNVWHPLLPMMWQGNSALFEVGICEFCCLNLLYLQFAPIVLEKLEKDPKRFPRLSRLAKRATPMLERVMPFLILAGCVAAFLHQSALGNLLVITPYKLHPLWHTPILSLLFLISAIGGGGFAMMCFESLFASWSLKLRPEMHVLSALARLVPPVMGLYLALKLGDMIDRKTYVYLRHLDLMSICWIIEVVLGVIVPVVMLLSRRVRHSPKLLFTAAALIVAGVIFNRINVFLIAYHPPYARTYFPSVAEFGITIGLFAFLVFGYRLLVTYFPVISQEKKAVAV